MAPVSSEISRSTERPALPIREFLRFYIGGPIQGGLCQPQLGSHSPKGASFALSYRF